MMIKHSFTISLLLMCAHIMGTISTTATTEATPPPPPTAATTSNSRMLSSSTMSPQTTQRSAQLGSSLNPGTKPSELISKNTWQGNLSSSPCINVTAETAAGGSVSLRPIFNTHSLFLCSIFTLLYILRQK